MEVDKNIYPAVGFNFRVTSSDAGFGLLGALKSITGFDSSQTDASFQEISGIKAKLETETYSPKGSNNQAGSPNQPVYAFYIFKVLISWIHF